MVSLCIPVLNRYDCLRNLLLSVRRSTIIPNRISIIDNGNNALYLRTATEDTYDSQQTSLDIFTPNEQMGVAESWNWFLRNIPDPRIITNDDIEFAPETIEKMLNASYGFVAAAEAGYSCFLLRDEIVAKVGYFDENISPHYGYYEDEDYATRVLQLRIPYVLVPSGLVHRGSQTLAAYSHDEVLDHHRKFAIAERNYINKWGGMPSRVKAQLAQLAS